LLMVLRVVEQLRLAFQHQVPDLLQYLQYHPYFDLSSYHYQCQPDLHRYYASH
jgi:hypothetical protein